VSSNALTCLCGTDARYTHACSAGAPVCSCGGLANQSHVHTTHVTTVIDYPLTIAGQTVGSAHVVVQGVKCWVEVRP